MSTDLPRGKANRRLRRIIGVPVVLGWVAYLGTVPVAIHHGWFEPTWFALAVVSALVAGSLAVEVLYRRRPR